MFNAIVSFFRDFFFLVFNILLKLIDFDSLEVAAAKAGENPMIAYFMIMLMAVTIVLMTTAIAVQSVQRLIMHLYKKKMQWRRYQARKAAHPMMHGGVVKAN